MLNEADSPTHHPSHHRNHNRPATNQTPTRATHPPPPRAPHNHNAMIRKKFPRHRLRKHRMIFHIKNARAQISPPSPNFINLQFLLPTFAVFADFAFNSFIPFRVFRDHFSRSERLIWETDWWGLRSQFRGYHFLILKKQYFSAGRSSFAVGRRTVFAQSGRSIASFLPTQAPNWRPVAPTPNLLTLLKPVPPSSANLSIASYGLPRPLAALST